MSHKRLLGIDYGAKRVGVASTDESGTFALPRAVVPNADDLVERVMKMADEFDAEVIVVGESKNLKGIANLIQDEINTFVAALREKGREVVFHPEVFTSMEADQLQGHNDMHDASAAALILKSYIDTHDHD